MRRIACLLLLAAAPAVAAPSETPRRTTEAASRPAPTMLSGNYPTLFMGPPRGVIPAPPPRPAAPPAATVAAPVGLGPAASPGALCRAAITTAERELGLPPHLLTAIGRVESGRRDPDTGAFAPWPWTINAEGRGSFFPAKAAAIAGVRQLQDTGVRSIDVGCMQVNLRHHPTAFSSLEEAFDPLTNARYAARFLRELQVELGDWNKAAAAYHSRSPEFSGPYQAKVLAAWAEEQRNPVTPTLAGFGFGRAGLPGGGNLLSNHAERALLLPVQGSGGGRGLDAYRSAPISAIGRVPVVYNGPYRRL